MLRSRNRRKPPLLGWWSRSRFFFVGGSGCIFFASKKWKPCCCDKTWLKTLKAMYNGKCDPIKTCITNSLSESSKWKILVHGAAFFCQEPEPTQFGRSRSRLRDLGLPEPEPPKKVAAPQHSTKHDLKAIYNGKCDPKKTCINNSLFKSSKWKMLVYGAGAAFFCLEPEPTQFGRSRSRLRDLGLPEPGPPKKVAAPQH